MLDFDVLHMLDDLVQTFLFGHRSWATRLLTATVAATATAAALTFLTINFISLPLYAVLLLLEHVFGVGDQSDEEP